MLNARRKFLLGLTTLLLAGLLTGWLYARPLLGLLIATALALAWQIRQLLTLERALQTGDLEKMRYGEGIWSLIVSRFDYLWQRGDKYKKRHRKLLKEFRKSTNALPDGAIILNDSFEIVTCNSAARDLVGFRRKEDRGQRVDNLLRNPKIADYLKAGESDQSVEIPSPVQEDHWLNCRLVPYGLGQHLLLVRDVTERMQISKTRRDFVANASHELRSPLTVISGYLHILAEDNEMPESWRKPVEEMHGQAERMTRIVSELLELSQLESKGPASAERKIDVCSLLGIARQSYAGQDGAPSIDVDCKSDAALLGDCSDIESVLTNLLTNAVRHTPATGIVTLRWASDQSGGVLSVEDNGEGIDAKDISRLTERFFRSDRGRSRDDGGVGLGLAIVKHALGRHEAKLEVHSEPGQGSRFDCVFPAGRITAPTEEIDRRT